MKPFMVMDIVKKSRQIEDVIHLEVGEPDIKPSIKVIKSAKRAIENDRFFYTESKGLKELREKIVIYYKKIYNVNIFPEQIIITTGTSTAFLIAYYFAKKIALSDPGYPCYENFAKIEKKEFVKIDVSYKTDYKITVNNLKNINFDTLLIQSVSNPTGSVYTKKELSEIGNFCDNNGYLLISDELYQGLVYNKEYDTVLNYCQNSIVINGFSKYFCMPGFRIGWMVLPKKYIRDAEIIAQNILISAPTISQYAALEAFDFDYLKFIKKEFQKRRDFIYGELKDIFDIKSADGAFYLWCDISKYKINSKEFCDRLLYEAKVAVTPGIDFGLNNTNSFFRIAYTKNIDQLQIAVDRIKKFIKNLKQYNI